MITEASSTQNAFASSGNLSFFFQLFPGFPTKKVNFSDSFYRATYYTARDGKSVMARDRERQPSTNQTTALTRGTPAMYGLYLPNGRNHLAYIAHRTRTRTYANAQHTAAHVTMDVRSRHTIELTHGQLALYWASPVNADDRLDVIMWIRCLGGERLPTASYALHPNVNKLFCSPRSRSAKKRIEIFVVGFLDTSRRNTFGLDKESTHG